MNGSLLIMIWVVCLHVSKEGELKNSCVYSPAPHFACSFGSNGFIVITSNDVNLHKLSLPKIV